jgi:hypothetical protein
MKSDDRTQATLQYRAGGSVTQPVPYPIPEAVLQIAQVIPDGPPTAGQPRPETKWGTRVFLLEGGTHDAPIYEDDTRYPDPTYDESSYVRIQCREGNTEPPVLFVKGYPRQTHINPRHAEAYCHAHYTAKYG